MLEMHKYIEKTIFEMESLLEKDEKVFYESVLDLMNKNDRYFSRETLCTLMNIAYLKGQKSILKDINS